LGLRPALKLSESILREESDRYHTKQTTPVSNMRYVEVPDTQTVNELEFLSQGNNEMRSRLPSYSGSRMSGAHTTLDRD
jgi:hypothetical protein